MPQSSSVLFFFFFFFHARTDFIRCKTNSHVSSSGSPRKEEVMAERGKKTESVALFHDLITISLTYDLVKFAPHSMFFLGLKKTLLLLSLLVHQI